MENKYSAGITPILSLMHYILVHTMLHKDLGFLLMSSPLSRDGETLELSDCCGLYEESAIAVGTSIHVLL